MRLRREVVQASSIWKSRSRPMPEVAGELEISLSEAKSRLLRCRHELKSRLDKYCGGQVAATLTA